MFSTSKIILFFLLGCSSVSYAQGSEMQQKKAAAEAREKQMAEAEAKEKAEEKRRKMFKEMLEKQQSMKSESSSKKINETAAATVNAKAEAFYSVAMSQINAKHVDWIKLNAEKISSKNLDELSVKVMADYYGKKEGFSETDIKGLTVLLVREAYKISNREYNKFTGPVSVVDNKKMSLLEIKEMLSDSSLQVSSKQLDSINLILYEQATEELTNENNSPVTERNEKREESGRKAPLEKITVSSLSLTQKKVDEKIELLNGLYKEEKARMLEIKIHQQKMTYMLSKMVNDVTEAQESIIQHLK